MEGDCREVVRCDKSRSSIRLASVKCPTGLVFDVNRQTCDWKDTVRISLVGRKLSLLDVVQVDNCDAVGRGTPIAKPNLHTLEPVCADGELQCGSGECIAQSFFCDRKPHCQDGSDENVCKGDEDPNKVFFLRKS